MNDDEDGVNQTFVYDGYTIGPQYDSSVGPIGTVEPTNQRTNMIYDAGPVLPDSDEPMIVEKPQDQS